MSNTCPEEENEYQSIEPKDESVHSDDLSEEMQLIFKEDTLDDSEVSGMLDRILVSEKKKKK